MKEESKNIQIRDLTVYGHFSHREYSRDVLVPHIRLVGKWLRDAGFEVEDQIKIVVSKKCLLILPNEEKQDDL